MQVALGNHEYGAPTVNAPAGTPKDSLANYKGRSFFTHGQAVPADTLSKTSAPGCAPAAGTTTNGCLGEDWGWFKVSGVLFISYPEPSFSALPDWQSKADTLMASAQNDSSVDYIVTYGHRPAYSSQTTNAVVPEVKTAIDYLGDRYSPAARAGGKYVLNVAHHAHSEEAFSPQHGVIHLTNGGGGEGQTSFSSTANGSVFKTPHPGYLVGDYSAAQHTLSVSLRCGPDYQPNVKEPCALGSTLHSVTFSGTPPAPNPVGETIDHFATCDKSVEAGLSCFAGRYSSNSRISWASAGYDGTHSVEVTSSLSSPSTAGMNAKINGASPVVSTQTGRKYNGSVWVKASQPGLKLSLYLRERRADNTSPGGSTSTWTATDTSWHLLQASYTAKEANNALAYSVFSSNVASSTWFQADLMQLTSANP